MHASVTRKLVMSFLTLTAVSVLALEGVDPAYAQNGQSACFVEPAKLSEAEVNAFLAEPGGLLSTYVAGGMPMANLVRSLAGSDRRALDALIALNEDATPVQRAAIGAGLARAAAACASSVPAYAALIQQKVAEIGQGELVTAFEAASADVETAALNTGQGGNTGGGQGGFTGGNGDSAGSGTAGTTAQTGTTTQSGTFSVGSAGRFSDDDDSSSVSPTN